MATKFGKSIAPRDVLRVVINLGNPVLAQGTPEKPRGVTVALALDLANWLGVPVELNCVDTARQAYDSVISGDVDLCFLANEPEREEGVSFTAPYVYIDGVYVVDSETEFRSSREVDRSNTRIAVRQGSAYDLFLSRTLLHAGLVRDDLPTAVYEQHDLEAVAGVRQPLEEYARSSGRRVLEPPFMRICQAVGVPRSVAPGAMAELARRVEHLKASGFVAKALKESGVNATVAASTPNS